MSTRIGGLVIGELMRFAGLCVDEEQRATAILIRLSQDIGSVRRPVQRREPQVCGATDRVQRPGGEVEDFEDWPSGGLAGAAQPTDDGGSPPVTADRSQ